MSRIARLLAPVLLAAAAAPLSAQRQLAPAMQEYVSVDAPQVAITNVTVIDGTGAPARPGQTVLIDGSRISAMGNAGTVRVPQSARVIDGSGHTLIPGLVGLHNHLYYTAAGGRGATLVYSAPRLYLGTGITTVRTTGSRAPYSELNMKAEIERGNWPGPRIHIT
ncbi:MAG: amidohydrolase, partial [Gemmatimonadetes bacterium]|nr:amidohydrolase [Gemmatimonadota bacterium]